MHPADRDRVGQASAVGEQVADGDPAGPPRRPHLPQPGNVPGDRASRSSTPRSARRTAAVAVTIFVSENHGHTMPGEAGTRPATSASPAAPAARRPSGPATSTAMPGTPSPAAARIRSPAIAPAAVGASQCPIPRAVRTHVRTAARSDPTQPTAGGSSTAVAGGDQMGPRSASRHDDHCQASQGGSSPTYGKRS
jgi:hypothetical protein